MCTFRYTCIRLHIHICTYMYICIHVYIHIYMYVHICIYVYVYKHICIHAYIYTYLYHKYQPSLCSKSSRHLITPDRSLITHSSASQCVIMCVPVCDSVLQRIAACGSVRCSAWQTSWPIKLLNQFCPANSGKTIKIPAQPPLILPPRFLAGNIPFQLKSSQSVLRP